MSETTRRFTGDTSDRRLLEVDIRGSIAHVEMLGKTGIIAEAEATMLADGLREILAGAAEFEFVETDEDVHTAVERRLGELLGDVAGKLHTGRSRNDQVALDLRLYLKEAAADRIEQLETWARALTTLAEASADVLIPTYTHLQQAQTTSLGNHLLAYAWMAVRDADRFRCGRDRLDSSPLGAGASAGSTLPLDREAVAAGLGLGSVVPNTLDAVGSRDFVSEYVFCCAQGMVHLSRFAEELVLWASQEFGWVRLGDTVSTGSSALPQKRNPDIAELIRGRAATVIGDTASILALQKGLPLAYNRDFQEDKRIVFHADDVLAASLQAIGELLDGVAFSLSAPDPGTGALPLAERLVGRGVPFREAHNVVGRLVKQLEDEGRSLGDAAVEDLVSVDPRFEPEDLDALTAPPQTIVDQLSRLRDLLGP
jgi:argininosuccinate lyase